MKKVMVKLKINKMRKILKIKMKLINIININIVKKLRILISKISTNRN